MSGRPIRARRPSSRPEIVAQHVFDRPRAGLWQMQELQPPDCLIEDREAISAGESLGRKRTQGRVVGEDIFNPMPGFRDRGAL